MRNRSLVSLVLLVFWLNACHSAMTPNPPPTLSFTNTPLKTPIATMPSFAENTTLESKTLFCSSYIWAVWGNGTGEWGDPSQLPGRSRALFPPPAFDKQGALYISDFVNHRLLKYDGKSSIPIEIRLPEAYFNPSLQQLQKPWAAIEIIDDRILVPYDINKLGILALDGTEEKNLELPYNYSLIASPWILVKVDSHGGIIINGEKLAYFDAGWRDGIWREISSRPAPKVGLFTWDDFVGFEAWAGSAISIYTISTTVDFFNNPSLTVNLPNSLGGGLIIGTDLAGWVYLETSIQSMPAYVRYSIPSAAWQLGIIRDNLPAEIIQSGVAPDGTIYLVMYSLQDVSINPQVIKCNFP
ncbi:MAG: hypothetical protein ACOYYI_06550 [Chloroflexota bacterium]